LFFLMVSPARSAKKGTGIETKIAIEKNLEERLKRILTEIIGTDKLIIVINVQLVSSEAEDEEEDALLPGVPMPDAQALGLASLDLGDTAKNIKSITAQIMVDKSLPESMMKIIEEVSTSILGLKSERGDTLNIKPINFRKNPFSWSDIIYPPHLWGLLFVGLAAALIVVFMVFGNSVFPKAAALISDTLQNALKKNEASAGGGNIPSAIAQQALAAETAAGGSKSDETTFFSFVRLENIDKLIFLLKKEKAENIAILINYAPNIADRILAGLDKDLAQEALATLTYTRSLPPADVSKWEKELKQKLDFMVGGKDVVREILEGMDDVDIDSYISFIKSGDSSFAEEIGKEVFRASSLAAMPAENILLLYQNINPVSFANVLRGLDENLRNAVLEKLPGGIATRMKEEIELGSDPGVAKMKEDKSVLADVTGRLRKAGLLS